MQTRKRLASECYMFCYLLAKLLYLWSLVESLLAQSQYAARESESRHGRFHQLQLAEPQYPIWLGPANDRPVSDPSDAA